LCSPRVGSASALLLTFICVLYTLCTQISRSTCTFIHQKTQKTHSVALTADTHYITNNNHNPRD
jgi:hypothetical protein